MRIIGGRLAGRKFDSRGFRSRPTTDMAKQALFNILSNSLEFHQLKAADLFAGTGAIAFELASRGAAVVAVERDRRHAAEIIRNAKALGLENLEVKILAAERFLQHSEPLDFVFADPPFDDVRTIERFPALVADSEVIAEGGLFVLEYRTKLPPSIEPFERRTYGEASFAFFPYEYLSMLRSL